MPNIGQNIVNQVRSVASAQYKSAVPLLTSANLTEVGRSIMDFNPTYNEFITVFFNKVALEIMDQRKFDNPFRELTKGASPFGGVIQNTQVNPAQALPYDVDATSRILHNYRPDVVTEYYTINRKDLFAVTRAREEMELAFVSFENLDRFFTSLIDSLYTGDSVREFSLYKALIASAYIDGAIRRRAVKTPVDKETAENFIQVLQGYSLSFRYPSSNYNAFQEIAAKQNKSVPPRISWSRPEDQIVILDSKLAPVISVRVLASAFNVEYDKLQARTLYVDDFAVTGLLGIIADVNWLQVRDSKRAFRDFENGATLTLNSFLHVWQYYNVCTFVNAIALYDPDAKPIKFTINDATEDYKATVAVKSSTEVSLKLEYEDVDVTEGASVDFISSTNNVVYGYNPSTKKIQIVTNANSLPGVYTVLVQASILKDTVPIHESVILTVTINPA